MTQNYPVAVPKGSRPGESRNFSLSLRQTVPADWHRDRVAFAGDPDFDWESGPEPPKETRWITERKPVRQPQ